MVMVRKTRAEITAARFTPKELARPDALTDAEITAAAQSDPDNPPLTAAEFKRMRRVGRLKVTKRKTKLKTAKRTSDAGQRGAHAGRGR